MQRRIGNRWAAGVIAMGLACVAHADELRYTRSTAPGGYRVLAQFTNFNKDALSLGFPLQESDILEALAEFGYSPAEVSAMAQDCTGCDQAEYDRRVAGYYDSRAIEVERRDGVNRLTVDLAKVVARNKPRMREVARALDHLAKDRGYGPDQTLEAALSFVQAALRYERPPPQERGRNILGFYPPPRALELGLGDCDTKSALLAATLANFSRVRMVGVHIPKHYLVGIARVPRHGEAFIEYRGERFVLMEPAGPARLPPGTIAESTRAALATMRGVKIHPLF